MRRYRVEDRGGTPIRTLTLVGALTALLLVFSSAGAEHCTTWSTSGTSTDVLVIEGPFLLFNWIVTDICQDENVFKGGIGGSSDGYEGEDGGCLFSIWLYYESNGIPGLQRGDEVVDDSCHGMIESDYFVW